MQTKNRLGCVVLMMATPVCVLMEGGRWSEEVFSSVHQNELRNLEPACAK